VLQQSKFDGVVNLHAVWNSESDKWHATLFASDLTNRQPVVYATDVSGFYLTPTERGSGQQDLRGYKGAVASDRPDAQARPLIVGDLRAFRISCVATHLRSMPARRTVCTGVSIFKWHQLSLPGGRV